MFNFANYKVFETEQDFNDIMIKDKYGRGYMSKNGYVIKEKPTTFPCILQRAENWDTHSLDIYYPTENEADALQKLNSRIVELEATTNKLKSFLNLFSKTP